MKKEKLNQSRKRDRNYRKEVENGEMKIKI